MGRRRARRRVLNIKKIGIVGKGWLGSILLSEFDKTNQYDAWSTTRERNSKEKKHFSFHVEEGVLPAQAQVVFFLVPPKNSLEYRKGLKTLVEGIPESTDFIYISSTSVFDESQGECAEDTTPNPKSERGKRQRSLEEVVLSGREKATIVRAAGLIGEDRHPIYSMRGRKLSEGDRRVNLIDGRDLSRILITLMNLPNKPRILHAVAPFHPKRSEYYTAQAKKRGFEVNFDSVSSGEGKVIVSRVLEEWAYEFDKDLYE